MVKYIINTDITYYDFYTNYCKYNIIVIFDNSSLHVFI